MTDTRAGPRGCPRQGPPDTPRKPTQWLRVVPPRPPGP